MNTDERNQRIRYLMRQTQKRRILPEFLQKINETTGQNFTEDNILSFEESDKIKTTFNLADAFRENNPIRSEIEAPEKMDIKIQKLASVLGANEYFLEFSHYDVGLLKCENQEIFSKWKELLQFDGDTVYVFSPKFHIFFAIDYGHNDLMLNDERQLENFTGYYLFLNESAKQILSADIEKKYYLMQRPSNKSIINCIEYGYQIKILELSFLPLGADMNAAVYKARTQEKSYFVKLKRGYDNNIILLELLQNSGIQVIIPINTFYGQPIQSMGAFTLIVYPFIEGQDGFKRHLTDNQWLKLGKQLRILHEIDVPPSILKQIRREEYSSKWRDFVKSYFLTLENEKIVDEIKDEIKDEIALKLLNFIEENILIIQKLVNRAEDLAQKSREQSSKFVLCHSDIHGGNVLLDENDNIYIVDWDDPIMAPKERDLMFIGGGVANVWNNPHEEMLFYKGYGNTEINKTILSYYRHERIVEDIALYIQGLLLTSAEGLNRSEEKNGSTEINGSAEQKRAEMYNQFIDMFKPNGVIDIAFKTDDDL